jgi:hypothetical protein
MRLLTSLALLVITTLAMAVDRLGFVMHPIYPRAGESKADYRARIDEKVAGIKSLGADRVRVHFNNRDVLRSDGQIGTYADDYAVEMLKGVDRGGLDINVTLPEFAIPFTVQANERGRRYIWDKAYEIFGPKRLHTISRNEPPEWAAGKFDPRTYNDAKSDVAYMDLKGYHAAGQQHSMPSYAGWFWHDTTRRPNAAQEAFYHWEFIGKRFLENRIGVGQRTAQSFSLYVSPLEPNPAGWVKIKLDGIYGLMRTHYVSHPIEIVELSMRIDLFTNHGLSEYMIGYWIGLCAKTALEHPEKPPVYVFDYNGSSALSFEGKPERQAGFRAAIH